MTAASVLIHANELVLYNSPAFNCFSRNDSPTLATLLGQWVLPPILGIAFNDTLCLDFMLNCAQRLFAYFAVIEFQVWNLKLTKAKLENKLTSAENDAQFSSHFQNSTWQNLLFVLICIQRRQSLSQLLSGWQSRRRLNWAGWRGWQFTGLSSQLSDLVCQQ